ncbi:hypothetical protein PSMK_22810 [Phycisphaera mikurensis NBRC 102666]|uniref:Uncharacterized protein n=1 Tax=Phycisphaera mikurensis (strain NBRC 102666 / KCTC 22515 / FYK2301M01) TaxID=1142394 RepID=I0IGQ2_PHYMF|nr:hypothetical protein PSMK_22810 [Phycisphaera mikurensis NBRC 102666]
MLKRVLQRTPRSAERVSARSPPKNPGRSRFNGIGGRHGAGSGVLNNAAERRPRLLIRPPAVR